MKLQSRKTLLLPVACLLALLLCFTFGASAAARPQDDVVTTITVAECDNGTVTVVKDTQNTGKALVTLSPAEGYLTSAVSLTTTDGKALELATTAKANVFTCAIPSENATLSATFRRATVTLDQDQLAMDSGETLTLGAKITWLDGEVSSRRDAVPYSGITFISTDEDAVSVDASGKLTANQMGYARIEARADYGNEVLGFVYVIVDGEKDEVVGTLQVNAHFDEERFASVTLPGHSFLIFTNTSGKDITIDASNFYQTEVPTEKFYEAVNTWDGEGYDPITYFSVTDGAYQDEDTLDVRTAHAAELFTRYERGQVPGNSYTIKANDIATFGNTGSTSWDDILGGDMAEVLERYGETFDLEKLKEQLLSGEIDADAYFTRIAEFLNEILYDTSSGFSPFNGHSDGGECLNHELYAQAFYRDYTTAVGCRVEITHVQLDAMVDFIQYNNNFNVLERNCTSVACDAWNLVTAYKPQYKLYANRGGVTTSLATPMWLRNSILAKAAVLTGDDDIQFINGIGVIKPAKYLGTNCTNGHNYQDGVCTDCGMKEPGYNGTEKYILQGILDNIERMVKKMLAQINLSSLESIFKK